MTVELTSLERTCIETVAFVHWPDLRLDGIHVARREFTGIGAYIYLEDSHGQCLVDGVYEAGGRMIEMEGLRFGLDFALCVTSSRLDHIELVAPGSTGWDGVTRPWRLL